MQYQSKQCLGSNRRQNERDVSDNGTCSGDPQAQMGPTFDWDFLSQLLITAYYTSWCDKQRIDLRQPDLLGNFLIFFCHFLTLGISATFEPCSVFSVLWSQKRNPQEILLVKITSLWHCNCASEVFPIRSKSFKLKAVDEQVVYRSL